MKYNKKNYWVLFFFAWFQPLISFAQQVHDDSQWLDISATVARKQSVLSASWVKNWDIGKAKKIELGIGARLSLYGGNDRAFITAPAKYARTNTTPFYIVIAGQKTWCWDTLTVEEPFTASLNLSGNAGYHFAKNWYAGLNIDLIGFSMGSSSSAVLQSNGNQLIEKKARPYNFNLLLTGDNDLGTLNSEFFIRYQINEQMAIKAIYQFFFTEYKTTTISQTAPDGAEITRFRNKVNAGGLGLVYFF
jgi:hypothetical protein